MYILICKQSKSYRVIVLIIYRSVRLTFLFFALALACAASFSAIAADVSADAAALLDADTGRVLWSKNGSNRLPMASTTKIMTALITIENCTPDDELTVSEASTRVEGSSMYLTPGEKLTVREALYGLMLNSGNDAALALAKHTAGSVDGFVVLMNRKCGELGLKDTSFANPNGLDGDGHFTTAAELGRITSEAMKHPEFCEIAASKTYQSGGRFMQNHNKLLWNYDGCVGVKTGFTKKSGRCLVSAAERDGTCLIAVTLNAPNDWSDHKKLLDYGFENYVSVKLCDESETFANVHVVSGVHDTASVRPNESLSVLVSKEDAIGITSRVTLPGFVYAPAVSGGQVGKLEFFLYGKPVASTELVFGSDVGEIIIPESNFREKMGKLFNFVAG